MKEEVEGAAGEGAFGRGLLAEGLLEGAGGGALFLCLLLRFGGSRLTPWSATQSEYSLLEDSLLLDLRSPEMPLMSLDPASDWLDSESFSCIDR